jgi:hypothetical protein
MRAKCEGGIHHELCYAINKRLKTQVKYKKDKDVRIIEPHDYGVLQGETTPKLLAYQLEGESRSGDLPEWREFEVADIRQLKVLGERFSGSRPALSGEHHNWVRVFASVSIPGEGCGCQEPGAQGRSREAARAASRSPNKTVK